MAARSFELRPATREQVPVLVGLFGVANSGKTCSAIRIATGIQSVTGGELAVIDTEARRSLAFADSFKFLHLDMRAPFGSLDYLAAIEHCRAKGAKVIVVDSLSHEHEGPGGYLDFHDQEVARLIAHGGFKNENAAKAPAWARPSRDRQHLINSLLQMETSFVFTFRAKEKVSLGGGTVTDLGWMPITGDQFPFSMTVTCFLPPAAAGMPEWSSDKPGERLMMKQPGYLASIFAEHRQLDERHGRELAEWAGGGTAQPAESVRAASEAGAAHNRALEGSTPSPATTSGVCGKPVAAGRFRCGRETGHPGPCIRGDA